MRGSVSGRPLNLEYNKTKVYIRDVHYPYNIKHIISLFLFISYLFCHQMCRLSLRQREGLPLKYSPTYSVLMRLKRKHI